MDKMLMSVEFDCPTPLAGNDADGLWWVACLAGCCRWRIEPTIRLATAYDATARVSHHCADSVQVRLTTSSTY